MGAKTKNPGASRRKEKISVSIPAEVLKAAVAQVEAGQSSSLSALVSEALAERVTRGGTINRYREWLRQLDEELGPPSPEAYAWAREALDL